MAKKFIFGAMMMSVDNLTNRIKQLGFSDSETLARQDQQR